MKILILTLALLFVSAPVFAEGTHNHNQQTLEKSSPVQQEHAMTFKRVDNEKVCMVNDKVFSDPQIPVIIGEQTYYGCCSMCKSRLERDVTIRTAIDPISGNQVDKSTAVIGAGTDGKVQYFENEENLNTYAYKHM